MAIITSISPASGLAQPDAPYNIVITGSGFKTQSAPAVVPAKTFGGATASASGAGASGATHRARFGGFTPSQSPAVIAPPSQVQIVVIMDCPTNYGGLAIRFVGGIVSADGTTLTFSTAGFQPRVSSGVFEPQTAILPGVYNVYVLDGGGMSTPLVQGFTFLGNADVNGNFDITAFPPPYRNATFPNPDLNLMVNGTNAARYLRRGDPARANWPESDIGSSWYPAFGNDPGIGPDAEGGGIRVDELWADPVSGQKWISDPDHPNQTTQGEVTQAVVDPEDPNAFAADGTASITSIEPKVFTAGQTASVTITGTGFAEPATVDVNGVTCTDIVVVSATEITCTVPETEAMSTIITVVIGENPACEQGTIAPIRFFDPSAGWSIDLESNPTATSGALLSPVQFIPVRRGVTAQPFRPFWTAKEDLSLGDGLLSVIDSTPLTALRTIQYRASFTPFEQTDDLPAWIDASDENELIGQVFTRDFWIQYRVTLTTTGVE